MTLQEKRYLHANVFGKPIYSYLSIGGKKAAFFRHRQPAFFNIVCFRMREVYMLIKELRQKRLLSQEQLAELCGLSLRTIQRVESGHRIGFASLRALAAEFNVNVESLEQELYTMEKVSNEFKDLPFWLKLYIGSSWFSANREEFKKIELFFLILSVCFLAFLGLNSIFKFAPASVDTVLLLGSFCTLAGAYNISVTIRTGDKYDVWSRLEATLPKRYFWFFGKNIDR